MACLPESVAAQQAARQWQINCFNWLKGRAAVMAKLSILHPEVSMLEGATEQPTLQVSARCPFCKVATLGIQYTQPPLPWSLWSHELSYAELNVGRGGGEVGWGREET